MMRFVVLASLALAACRDTPSSDRVVAEPLADAAPAETTRAASAAPVVEAGAPVAFRVGLGVDPDEEIGTLDETSASASALCTTFLRKANADAATIAQSFSFQQRTPSCALRPAPAAFRPGGTFLDARVLVVNHVSRRQHLLALRLARGWVISWIAWNVDDSESAIPPWAAEAPERIDIDGSRFVAYLPGGDVAENHGPGDKRWLRGAFACKDDGASLHCAKWDPTERPPLGGKTAKTLTARWSAIPWSAPMDLAWQPNDSARAVPVP